MVRRRKDQKLRLRNFWRQTWENRNRCSGQESQEIKWCWKRKRCLWPVERKRAVCSFRHESNDRAKPTPKAEPLSEPQSSKTRGRSVSRKRNRSQSEKFNRPPCKHLMKGTCTKLLCEYWHPPECQFYKRNRDVSSALSAHSRTGRLKNNQTKSRKRVKTKVQLLLWKVCNSWVVYHRTLSRQILQRFPLRQANIREKEGPSLGKIQGKIPHQQSPYAMKFEDRYLQERL